MNLIIVESPTKARTLSKFLGSAYSVEATMGHIKDLPKSTLGVNVDDNFLPEYVSVDKRKDIVKTLLQLAKKSSKVYIATDPDREGEAIAAHVKEILIADKKTKTDIKNLERIVFHEITKEAVEEAIKNPRDVDTNLVDAQTARRVLDRLVGYKLSPLLWKKVRRGLSAGRVQTVAVRLIVEKEKEIEAFKSEEYWEIFCDLKKEKGKNKPFSVKLVKVDGVKASITNGKVAKEIVGNLEKAQYKVSLVGKREVIKRPYAPFTTSTMSQTAAGNFGWSAKRSMSVAQKLYENGLITYHRTDSTNIAAAALQKVRDYIKKEFGQEYLPEQPNFYKTKSKVAQEAHEAIRPTNLNTHPSSIEFPSKEEATLYSLIWSRFVACQMAPSRYDETTIEVEAKSGESLYLLKVTGQIMKFDGWRKVIKAKESEVIILPEVENGESLQLVKVNSQQKFTEPPARFNEASLIKMLEKLGIGRPSTYAPIISTIQIRNYVEKKEGKFFPTPIGVAVNDFLIKYFPLIFDYQFTAEMENNLDEVANGNNNWQDPIRDFWNPFNTTLEKVEEKAERVKIETESLNRKCPDCKEGELVVRIGRFGKFISCSRFPDCKHTEKLVEKAGMKCPECGKGEVVVKTTKRRKRFYGCSEYPKCKWASWKKPQPVTTVNK